MRGYRWQKVVIPMCIAAGALLAANPEVVLGQSARAPQTEDARGGGGGSQAVDAADKTQESLRAVAESLTELRSQMQALQTQMSALQSDAASARADAADLRQQLAATRIQLAALQGGTQERGAKASPAAYEAAAVPAQGGGAYGGSPYGGSPNAGTGSGEIRAGQNGAAAPPASEQDEIQQLTDSKLNDLYQTKVESGSKYRLRLSGMALLGLFDNRGTVDSQDIPQIALPPDPTGSPSSFGGSMRQSQIGLEAFGPDLFGAQTSASIKFDFAGGMSEALDGSFMGLVRLRTGTIRLDWTHTSIIAGQDYLFFVPLAPTSLASTAIPALSYSGNLWGWVPQVRAEHRMTLSEKSSFLLQGGIMDSLSGDVASDYQRFPTWGEQSGYPAIAGRAGWTYRMFGQDMTVGVGGFYGRQNWALGRNVNGWAATADLIVPLGNRFTLTSAFYRGGAVAGLWGAIGQDVLVSGSLTDPMAIVKGLDSEGGWAQLQFRPGVKWQINGTWGMDNPFAGEMRPFAKTMSAFGPLFSRNMSATANFIYRVRSDVLFSVEYRRLRTNVLDGGANAANLVEIALGYQF